MGSGRAWRASPVQLQRCAEERGPAVAEERSFLASIEQPWSAGRAELLAKGREQGHRRGCD